MHDRAGNVVHLEHRALKGRIKCGVAPSLDHSVLIPSGRLALCCMTFGLEHIIGDLSTTPYSDILRGPAIEDIKSCQQDGRNVACRKCVCAVPA